MSVRVRLLQQMSGSRGGVPWPGVGEVIEVSDDEAASLCRRTDSQPHPIAVRVEDEDVEEAAAKNPKVQAAAAAAKSGDRTGVQRRPATGSKSAK